MIRIDLPFPDKALWPNGGDRNHPAKVARLKKKHREWAGLATLKAKGSKLPPAPIPVTVEVHPKPRGPLPDRDNCVAACKAYFDGIADTLGVNDRDFDTPRVVFSPERDGRIVVEIGE